MKSGRRQMEWAMAGLRPNALNPLRGGAAGLRCAANGTKLGPFGNPERPVAGDGSADSGKGKEGAGSSPEKKLSVIDQAKIAGPGTAENHQNPDNRQRGK